MRDFDYAFEHYDDFEHIKDPEFHRLRQDYLKAKEALAGYVKWEDEEKVHEINESNINGKIKELPDDMIVRLVLLNPCQAEQLEEPRRCIDINVGNLRPIIDKHDNVLPELFGLLFTTLLNHKDEENTQNDGQHAESGSAGIL